jgi:glycine hydroxymethyltransferase
MGCLEVSGPNAIAFLDVVFSNYAHWLGDGQSCYGYLLDPDGKVIDDMMIYRRRWDRFLVVVNASNADKDWDWLNAVNERRVVIDRQRPWVQVAAPAVLRNLKDPSWGADQLRDVALQGPASLAILQACTDDPGVRFALAQVRRTDLTETELGGIPLVIARTGYTGEDMGFEIFVHPDQQVAVWNMLLDRGKPFGLRPCGLAARDSTRTEAGLPLYGHELAGPFGISPTEAGFPGYIKYHKPFFIGRGPYKAYNDASTRRIIRFQVSERGARALRGGEHGEPVVSTRGRVIGSVTSCALVGDRQVGMAIVEERYAEPGTDLLIYPVSQKGIAKAPQAFEVGDAIAVPVRAEVLPRFPGRTG